MNTVNEAAQILGRLGGLAGKGNTSEKKARAARRNAAKARRALAEKRKSVKPKNSLDTAL